jgi:anti-anti-sigma factor
VLRCRRAWLDITCVPALREQLLGLLRPGTARLAIDLCRVSYADTSGLAVLVGTGRRAGLLGGFLRLAAPPPSVAKVLRVTGLHGQLDVFATVQAAITSPGGGQRRPDGTAEACMDAAGSTLHTEPAPLLRPEASRSVTLKIQLGSGSGPGPASEAAVGHQGGGLARCNARPWTATS